MQVKPERLEEIRQITRGPTFRELIAEIDRLNKLVEDLTKERDGLLAAIPEAWKED
jgi:hypothetical protein